MTRSAPAASSARANTTPKPTATAESPAGQAERELEIRQMLKARSERLVRNGQPALDVDAELARLLAFQEGGRASDRPDPELVGEVRPAGCGTQRTACCVKAWSRSTWTREVERTLEQLEP